METSKEIPNYCILSGSRGFGEPHENSDYDFYVPEKKWSEFKKWIVVFATKNGLEIESCIPGQLAFRTGPLHKDLYEFSYLFPKNQREYKLFERR